MSTKKTKKKKAEGKGDEKNQTGNEGNTGGEETRGNGGHGGEEERGRTTWGGK